MIKVKINTFEGPLDLLLHLIEKAEVDIYDISIVEITDQYLEYIGQWQQVELEITSEFLVMAATLLAMKSKMLLPKEEITFQPMLDLDTEEEDPREQLIQRLVEYKRYKQAALQLREQELARSQVYTRPAENLAMYATQEESPPLTDVSVFDLITAFDDLYKQRHPDPLVKVEREEISIDQKISELKQLLQVKKNVSFQQLFQDEWTKEMMIVTFLALLELMKSNEIQCSQSSLFEEIRITFVSGE